jgi:hypothetical protein
MQQKEKYQQQAAQKLAEFEKKIAAYKQKAAAASEEARARINERVENLTQQANHLKQKIRELRAASANTWENLQGEIDQAFDKLQATYDDAQASLQ